MSPKKLFAAALSTSLHAGAALAQGLHTMDDIVALSDGPATIIKFPESATYTNGFLVVCPTDLVYDAARGRDKAIVFLFNHARQELEEEYRDGLRFDDGRAPTTNNGLIGDNNQLYLSYTYREEAEAKGRFVRENPDRLPGSDPRDPALLRALRQHAENFCFSIS